MGDVADAKSSRDKPCIEVGWVFAGQFNAVDVRALKLAQERLLLLLKETFAAFDWKMPVVYRRELIQSHRVPPVVLIETGAAERELGHWDFACVVTEADLIGHLKPYVLGTPSQALSVGVLSTSRIDPEVLGEEVSVEARVEALTRRATALALHLFGHMNHVSHSDASDCWMFDLRRVEDLDQMVRYSASAAAALSGTLARVGDVRLEERSVYQSRQGVRFVLNVLWAERAEVFYGVMEARPWRFPFQLSRLTMAAASALLLLINTAEAWDLGMSQPPEQIVLMSLAALFGMTLFVIKRQRLLVSRDLRGLSEQRVIAMASIVMSMGIGMLTTYVLLFMGTLLIAVTLFSQALVTGWASSLAVPPTTAHYLVFAGFVAMLGLIIGAMGASFEEEAYLRHVAFVDEET